MADVLRGGSGKLRKDLSGQCCVAHQRPDSINMLLRAPAGWSWGQAFERAGSGGESPPVDVRSGWDQPLSRRLPDTRMPMPDLQKAHGVARLEKLDVRGCVTQPLAEGGSVNRWQHVHWARNVKFCPSLLTLMRRGPPKAEPSRAEHGLFEVVR